MYRCNPSIYSLSIANSSVVPYKEPREDRQFILWQRGEEKTMAQGIASDWGACGFVADDQHARAELLSDEWRGGGGAPP
jgi:hypothetical protein